MQSLTRQQLVEFITAQPRRVHFVGIGGSGMSGLAWLMAEQGHQVSGCDLAVNGEVQRLRRRGVKIFAEHSVRHATGQTELFVHSSAINLEHAELQAAGQAGIPRVRRGLMLSALMNHRQNIAVAGTHGKTTTSAMIAQVLTRSDSAPSFCIGAHVPSLGANARMGGGKYFVAEADESDGTLVGFTPEYAVCLNIEAEHLDYHGSMTQLLAGFGTFLASALRTVFYCADCPATSKLARSLPEAISFGLSPEADYRALEPEATGWGSRFAVACRDQRIGVVELAVPGRQNIVNALAAVAVADQLGVPFDKMAEALREFSGARRRFEKKFDGDDLLVVDDYAHHPTEVRATIEAARTVRMPGSGQRCRRLVAVFQPHRYSRTRALQDSFAGAFEGVDRLYLTDIYAAGETPVAGVSGEAFCETVRAANPAREVAFAPDLNALARALRGQIQPGDLIMTMGAGDVYRVANALADQLAIQAPHIRTAARRTLCLRADLAALVSDKTVIRCDEPMAPHTSLRIGGPAQVWVEPWDERDLARVLRYCHGQQAPLLVVGRGTNLIVRDEGIAGVVVRLGSPEFERVTVDDTRVLAGAGARLRTIVNVARRHELGGLEFMEGIPGSVGGALRMNAGAMGRQTFDVVEWVRYVSLAGEVYDAEASTLPVMYRNCPVFAHHIALLAILRGERAARVTIDGKLRGYADRRRATQPARPSAGCVFKNPPSVPAGKLIEELGFKGLSVGRARVSEVHGNFIVNDGGARATEVLDLIAMIRERARNQRGIELETEVMVVGGKEAE
jgi:UDP-N-acetylmuramate--alanine ligase